LFFMASWSNLPWQFSVGAVRAASAT